MTLEKSTLQNGLRLYVDTIPSAETANVNVFVGTGSVHEPDELAGIAHALEHCVHVSTHNFQNETALDQFDGSHSIVSGAETSYNRTVYSSSGPMVEPIIKRMGEILFRASYRPKPVRNEMSVIRREAFSRRDDYENIHDVAAYYAAFGKPYGRDMIGYADKLHFTPEQLKKFYDQHYVLSNMAVVAVGNVVMEDMIESINRHFVDNQNTFKPTKLPKPQRVDADITGLFQDGSENALITVTVPLKQSFIKKYLNDQQRYESAMRVLDNACSNMLRLEKGLSYDGSIEFRTDNNPRAWGIQGSVTVDPHNVAKAQKVFQKTLQSGSKRFSDTQIEVALGSKRSAILSAMDSLESRSEMYIYRLDHGVEPEDLSHVSRRVRHLSTLAVRETIDEIVDYSSQNEALTHITGASRAVKAAQLLINPDFLS